MLVTESEDSASRAAAAEFGVSLLAAALNSHLSDATVVHTSSDGDVGSKLSLSQGAPKNKDS